MLRWSLSSPVSNLLGSKMAEEVYQIALISTGGITVTWGFAIAPAELQVAVEDLSLGSLMRWRLR